MDEFASLRRGAGLSVRDAAKTLGYAERHIRRWERGEGRPRPAILRLLRTMQVKERAVKTDFTFIDLFAGIGGLRKGFEEIGGRCTFTCEWDRFARETYQANFPKSNHEIAHDIRDVPLAKIGEHDVLLAGFPCQPFSLAGVSKKNSLNRPHGFADETQGTLFFNVAQIIAEYKPKAFLLENVKNLLTHDKKRTFAVICDVLENQLGYKISHTIIDAKGWLPQHRERIFIAGFREDVGCDLKKMQVRPASEGPKLGSILHGLGYPEEPEERFTTPDAKDALGKYTLTDNLWNYLQRYAAKHKSQGNGFGFGEVGPDDVTRTLSARYYKDGSEILVRRPGHHVPRRLTPRECARLMGFDRPGQPLFKIPVSDMQAYRQFGNSVAVPVVIDIAKYMQPFLAMVPDEEFAAVA